MPPLFTSRLLDWDRELNRRLMPWKGEKDPYKIWLSEVILQQTRVEQGWNYYNRFIEAFPTISSLALAEDQQVFKLWEGLGYYSRCRNLIATARLVMNDHNGVLPGNYHELLKLKGIGPYTAAAISSFAFGEKQAVVDGNVQRVLARYFGVSIPVGTAAGKKFFLDLAQSLIPGDAPAKYNQAIMDFGAMICKPKQPACLQCVQSAECEAFRLGKVAELPVKEAKLIKRHRWFNYFIVESKEHIYIRERTDKDIWQHLYEFLLVETSADLDSPVKVLKNYLNVPYSISPATKPYKQVLSHQVIHARFSRVVVAGDIEIEGFKAVKKAHLNRFPFPRVISLFLQAESPENTDL